MKKSLVLFSFLLLSVASRAQFWITPALYVGPTSLSSKNVSDDPAYSGSSIWFVDFGIRGNYFFTDHFGVGLGAMLTGYGSNYQIGSFLYQGVVIPADAAIKLNAGYISIPLSVEVKTNKPGKIGFYFEPLIQGNFAISYSEERSGQVGGISVDENLSGTKYLSPVMLTLGAGLGLEVATGSRGYLHLGPRLEFASSDINASDNRGSYTASSGVVEPYEPWVATALLFEVSYTFGVGKK